jgi:transposase-like protein
MRNLLTRVPRSAQSFVATMVRSIFAQPDAETVLEQHVRVVTLLEERFPAAAELLAEAAPDLLPFTHFPKEHWRQLWSNNSLERLNKRSAAAPTSSASSPTAPPSSAWWERSWPSNTMSGPSPAGT